MNSAAGQSAASDARCGGSARVSATRRSKPSRGQPARHRETAVAESEHERAGGRSLRAARCGASLLGAVRRGAHRSFSVESPTSTSIMLMIQNRTTTCVSFQPDSSKWWCSGAIRKMRLPLVHLK